MEIRSNLKGENYDALIEVAKMLGTSSTMLSLKMWGRTINAELSCEEVKICDGARNLDGSTVPPMYKYAFALTTYMPLDLIDKINASEYKEIVKLDGYDYYLCEVKTTPFNNGTAIAVYQGKDLWK